MNETARKRRQQAHNKGHRSERLAAFVLMLKGYRILEQRYRTPLGEIDIAKRRNLVAIVEVKARPTLEQAMDAVSPSAQYRIDNAATLWLSRQPDYSRLSLRYDLVAVLPRRWPVHVKNLFSAPLS